MNDRFYVRYFNKNTKEFEYHKIGAINTKPYTDCTIYEEGQFCTGLHDKNGKLIYEGDILKDDSNIIASVYWEEEEVKFIFIEKSHYVIDISKSICDEIEVIGNIYENKELLNDH